MARRVPGGYLEHTAHFSQPSTDAGERSGLQFSHPLFHYESGNQPLLLVIIVICTFTFLNVSAAFA